MIAKKNIRKKIEAAIQHLQRFTDRFWYPPLIGFLSLIDTFIIIIPTDGILISSTMLKPKSWLYFSLCVTIGSTLGALILFYLVNKHGLPYILDIFPGINQGKIWLWTEIFFQKYGLLLIFIVSAAPLMQQPVIVLASLAQTPLLQLLAVLVAGRLLKYFILSYIGSHAPRLLSKLWGVKGELSEVGIYLNAKVHKPK